MYLLLADLFSAEELIERLEAFRKELLFYIASCCVWGSFGIDDDRLFLVISDRYVVIFLQSSDSTHLTQISYYPDKELSIS